MNDKKLVEYREDDTELYVNSHIIGKGIYMNSSYNIEKNFIMLLENDIICQKLIELVNNYKVLNTDIEFIVKNVTDISKSIKSGHYNKILSCCPTIWKLIFHR